MVDSEPEWFLSEIEVTKPFFYTWLEFDQIACLGGPLSKVGHLSMRSGQPLATSIQKVW